MKKITYCRKNNLQASKFSGTLETSLSFKDKHLLELRIKTYNLMAKTKIDEALIVWENAKFHRKIVHSESKFYSRQEGL